MPRYTSRLIERIIILQPSATTATPNIAEEHDGIQPRPGELDLFRLVVLLRRNLLRILLCAVAGFLLMAAYSLQVKPRFSASASAVVPPPAASAVSVAQAVDTFDLLGGGAFDIYLDILNSEMVADRLIARFDLTSHYGAKDQQGAEKALAAATKLAAGREGLLRVTVEDRDPKLAAALADAYLAQLDVVNQSIAITAAGQRRKYYEREMTREKDALADAEVALEQSQQKNGVVEPQLQVQAALGTTENIRAQLRARQVERGALLQGETAQNPEVIRLDAQIASLEGQLHAAETAGGESTGSPISKVPERTLTYVRRARDVKFHETLFDILARDYELAKQQEAKDISGVQILDAAKIPLHKSWPPRTLYSLVGLLIGAVLGVVFTVFEAFARAVMKNPVNRARLHQAVLNKQIQSPDASIR